MLLTKDTVLKMLHIQHACYNVLHANMNITHMIDTHIHYHACKLKTHNEKWNSYDWLLKKFKTLSSIVSWWVDWLCTPILKQNDKPIRNHLYDVTINTMCACGLHVGSLHHWYHIWFLVA